MNRNEIALLRTKLRQINMEYSALVRAKRGDGARARMEALRAQRRAVMVLIAEQRLRESVHSAGAASLVGSEISAAYAVGATLGSGALSIERDLASASGGDRFSA